ncbi:hypothetical protein [Streptomyces tibetensis]|uniref:hypothetical protein n=1 Tax=Streptomyces tibetensis TaxID=2382123 RepID=UPI003F4CE488
MNLLPATDDPTTTRTRRQGCLRAVGVTTLVLPAAADVLIAVANGKTLWPVLLLLSLGLAVVLRPGAHRPAAHAPPTAGRGRCFPGADRRGRAARGGGFGLVGLTERVTALGGTLHTGPRKNHGWEVVALLPTVRRTD